MTVVSLGELGQIVSGNVCGDPSTVIACAMPLESKLPADSITLVDNGKLIDQLHASNAVAAVVSADFPETSRPVIRVAQPHAAFEAIIGQLRPLRLVEHRGVHVQAFIDPSASLGPNVCVGAGASIGAGVKLGRDVVIHRGVHVMADCVIGDQCELYPGVVLYPRTILGDRCTLHAGCVLGAIGFGYRTTGGKHLPAAQLGWVEMGDDVELGACVTIDRGTYGPTRIGTGTKIDNQVMIGHNCQIGKHNLICAQVGIAGSSSTGDYVVMAGQVGVKDHVHLGDRVVVAAKAGVMHDLNGPGPWSGAPAVPVKEHMKTVAAISRLPEMRGDLRELQKEMAAMREQLAQLQSGAPVTHPKAA